MEATRNKPPVPPLSARRRPRRRCFSSALSGPSAEAISHYSHCAALPQLSVSPRHHPYHSLPFDCPRRGVIDPNSIPASPMVLMLDDVGGGGVLTEELQTGNIRSNRNDPIFAVYGIPPAN